MLGCLLAGLGSKPQPHSVLPDGAASQCWVSCRLLTGSPGKPGPGALSLAAPVSSWDPCCTVSTVRLSLAGQSSSSEAESWFRVGLKQVCVNKSKVWKKTQGSSDGGMFFRALYRDLSLAVHPDQAEENCSREETPPPLLSLMSSNAVDTSFSGKPLPERPALPKARL